MLLAWRPSNGPSLKCLRDIRCLRSWSFCQPGEEEQPDLNDVVCALQEGVEGVVKFDLFLYFDARPEPARLQCPSLFQGCLQAEFLGLNRLVLQLVVGVLPSCWYSGTPVLSAAAGALPPPAAAFCCHYYDYYYHYYACE